MASFVLLFSLLLILSAATTAVGINFTTFNAPPAPSATPQTPPTHLQETPQQQQFNSIIDSIVGAGDFSNWATLLAQADPSIFPLSATFLIPDDAAFLAGNATSNAVDPLLFLYHIVPRRFTFSELRLFPSGAHLPTLLPGKTLLITNNSAGNFTVNGAQFTHPDLFKNDVISLHGIGSVLKYNLMGEDASSPENSPDSVTLPENSQDSRSWDHSLENSSESVPLLGNSSGSVSSLPSQVFIQPGFGFPKIDESSAAKSKGERVLAYMVGVVMLLYVLLDGIGQYEFLCVLLNIILAMVGTYQISRRYFL